MEKFSAAVVVSAMTDEFTNVSFGIAGFFLYVSSGAVVSNGRIVYVMMHYHFH